MNPKQNDRAAEVLGYEGRNNEKTSTYERNQDADEVYNGLLCMRVQ
jgi:hypothetical protein